jgi:hypothetical protein
LLTASHSRVDLRDVVEVVDCPRRDAHAPAKAFMGAPETIAMTERQWLGRRQD